jgi:hypothetical protein
MNNFKGCQFEREILLWASDGLWRIRFRIGNSKK